MEKFKRIFELFGGLVIILFLVIYIGQWTGYYQITENRKVALTEDAIKRFEADVQEGKEIIASNYLVKEKNYNNNISILCMKVSEAIENGFNKIMGLIFRELEAAVNGG